MAEVKITGQNNIEADLKFEQADADSPVSVKGQVSGLPPGNHGMHVHELANDGDDCNAAGGHFNPEGVRRLFTEISKITW